jgi:histidinol-phosphate phosphatase family protein
LTVSHLVIVAGGKGTRLASVMGEVPKVLARVGGKPVLQHQLELATAAGVTGVTILAGHLAGQIEDFVGDGSRFGLQVKVLVEDRPLGNAGLLVQSLSQLPEQFFVLYGDVMLAVDLGRMGQAHLTAGADFTTFVHPNDHPFDSDLLEVDAQDRVTAIRTYPHPVDQFFANRVNAALYVVRRDALADWADHVGKLDFTKDIMPALVARGAHVLAYQSEEYIKDMGTPARLEKVERDLAAGKISLDYVRRPRPAVFLDRDGTLNIERQFLASPDGLDLLPGAGAAVRALRQAGYRLVVLTNQPVIARGEASFDDVAAIHRKLEWELGKDGAFLDAIYLCPHHPDKGFAGERAELKIACDCRKPGIGMVQQACNDLAIDLAGSWMVGDQTRDIEMARRAGLKSILVRTGAAGSDRAFDVTPELTVADIAAAAEAILASRPMPAA